MEFLRELQPKLLAAKGDPRLIAQVHVDFYKFFIHFASRCDALAFDAERRQYFEECIDFLLEKEVTAEDVRQSGGNILEVFELLSDLCVTWGQEKDIISELHAIVNWELAEGQVEVEGVQYDLLIDENLDLNNTEEGDIGGPSSPGNVSTASSELGGADRGRGAEVMTKYLLSDLGMDSCYGDLEKHLRDEAITSQMNRVLSDIASLQQTKYTALDILIAKMELNVPIWNYHNHRVDLVDPHSAVGGSFDGIKTVTKVVLQNSPDVIRVGPFSVYLRNGVFVYECGVGGCSSCLTTSFDSLRTHVKFYHGSAVVDWSCSHCELVTMLSESQKSLDGALDHLAKFHTMKSTYTLSVEKSMEMNKQIAQEVGNSAVCPVDGTSDPNDLFHCPVDQCQFSSNSLAVAFSHLSSIPVHNFNCSYCKFFTFSAYEFCKHVLNSHGAASYKCGLCCYRSVSKANLIFHQRDAHEGMSNTIIGLDPQQEVESTYNCQAHNMFKPFICGEMGCEMRTLVQSKFSHHLLQHRRPLTCANCKIFKAQNVPRLIDHLSEAHDIGQFRCLYCTKASNYMTEMESHLQECHSSQYPYTVICQDFAIHSPSLRAQYSKSHRLDINDESIIVLSLDSDRDVGAIAVGSSSTVVIDDVDGCKMQLRAFFKNVYKEEVEVVQEEQPRLEDTLDLTAGEEPQEALEDVKPRLRLRNIEELMRSSQPGTSKEAPHSGSTIVEFEVSQPSPTLVTIKKERHTDQVPQQRPVVVKKEKTDPVVPAVRIKMEQQKDDEPGPFPIIQSVQSLSSQPEVSNAPVLFTAASINDVPVDFDCDVADDQDLSVIAAWRYSDQSATDTIIISDTSSSDEEDSPPSTKHGPTVGGAGPSSAPTTTTCSSQLLTAARQLKTSLVSPTSVPQNRTNFKCSVCDFTSESRIAVYSHVKEEHRRKGSQPVNNVTGKPHLEGDVQIIGVSCPYCKLPGRAYETLRGFFRHHSTEHFYYPEIKCFLIFKDVNCVNTPDRILACSLCTSYCRNEDALMKHLRTYHKQKIGSRRVTQIKSTVALKKLVCPIYTCLEEYFEPQKYREHLATHESAIACKGCSYVAGTMEAFKEYHDSLDPTDRLTHFYYKKSTEEIVSMANTQRFKHPLYSLSSAVMGFPGSNQSSDDLKSKATARKSTGNQYQR